MSIAYSSYEIGRVLQRHLRVAASIQTDLLTRVPAAAGERSPVRAANVVVQALKLTHERPDFGIQAVDASGESIEVREHIVSATPFGSLVRFAKATAISAISANSANAVEQPKVLVVPGLAGHYATLVRGTVQTLLPDHDVYVADWANARDIPLAAGRFGLDEYIEHLMQYLREIGPNVHLMGICQPAIACIAAASIMSEDADPCQPASLILLAGPVDTRANPSKVSRFAQRTSPNLLKRTLIHSVPRHIEGAGRRVYPGFLQVSGFMGMDIKRHVKAFLDLYHAQRSGDSATVERIRTFYAEYFAVLDISEEFYLETAQRIFIEHHLPRGEFSWRGRHVDPSNVSSALFTIEGANDDMCPPGQTKAAHDLCSGVPNSRRRHLVQEGVGHYGVFAGAVFRDEIYPQIREFIRSVERKPLISRRPTCTTNRR